MKLKNAGISLFVSLGVSFTVLGIAMAIMVSISRSLQQSTTLERSNQVFFAAESGVEAAFFHHNARGQGVNFVTTPTPNSQKIIHNSSSAEVGWSISGRTAGNLNDPIVGLLKENERVQLKFFADSATDPSQPPNVISYFPDDFELIFYNQITDTEAVGSPEEKIFQKYGDIDIGGFSFDANNDDVLIDWGFSGQRNSDGGLYRPDQKRESLVPSKLGDPQICGASGSYLCVGNTFGFGPTFDIGLEGKILPYEGGEITETLQDFENTHDNVSFSFQSLQKFESGGTKIPGIPFAVLTGTQIVPKDSYTVQSRVSIGNFYKTISLDVKEKSSIGAFNYVIFD
ncbi:hypothetical protein K9L27_00615 [Candidatus Gracilibacteria bacterium]|nr:hypothetical protein [Candidatus Gracilibacteria bacterium]